MHNVASDKTIIGVGGTAVLSGGGLNIGLPVDDAVTSPPANAVHNIIIRNIHFTGTTDDLIYKNYYFDNSYGIASTYDSGVLVEGNYFFSVNNPGRVEFSGDLGRIVERTGRRRGGQDLRCRGTLFASGAV